MTVKMPITSRMILRIKAFISLESATLPGFCEGMNCNETCPLYRESDTKEPCIWIKTYTSINTMEEMMNKAIDEDEIRSKIG